MSAPLICVPIFAASMGRSRAEEYDAHLRKYDPVKAGFDDFAEHPRVSRRVVAANIFKVAAREEEISEDLVRRYAGDIATAAVLTATSTGKHEVTPSLIFRAVRAHYTYETSSRIGLQMHPLKAELNAHAREMGMFKRRNLVGILCEHAVGGPGVALNCYSGFDGFTNNAYGEGDGKYKIKEAARIVTENDISSQELIESQRLEDGRWPEPHEVALASLSHLPGRIGHEVSLMRSTIQAVRTMLPDFARGETE